jgi:hypothetical protein
MVGKDIALGTVSLDDPPTRENLDDMIFLGSHLAPAHMLALTFGAIRELQSQSPNTRARAASERALSLGPRLASKEKPTKPNQTKPKWDSGYARRVGYAREDMQGG